MVSQALHGCPALWLVTKSGKRTTVRDLNTREAMGEVHEKRTKVTIFLNLRSEVHVYEAQG